jgi:peptidoglycan hydrolase CwlO-like protein
MNTTPERSSAEVKTTEIKKTTPNKDYRNIIIGVLAVILVGLGAYLIFDKNKTTEKIEQQQAQIATVTDEKSTIQQSFDASLSRLDSVKSVNGNLQSQLEASNSEIAKTKAEIRSILNKKNATAAELNRAKQLIASLNSKISDMQAEVARLTQDNQTLTQEKTVLTEEKTVLTAEKEKLNQDLSTTTVAKQELEKKVDVASTLNASNISITPVKLKGNGEEKVVETAKRVDKLKISFDVDNRIAQPGTTDVYVLVLGPDGKPVTNEALHSGTFTTREEGDKSFTTKLPVEVQTAKRTSVQFQFAPGNFQQGNYTIQIYQNGFKIGESRRELKKGGLFS